MTDAQETAYIILGVLGNITSCAFFLSSAPTICNIIREKSAGGLSGDLYVFKLFNCLLWTFYGLPFIRPHNFWVLLTNSAGCIVALLYIFPYLYYATRKQRTKVLWELGVIISSFVVVAVVLLVVEHSQRTRITVVGILCAIVSGSMHVTLLSQMEMIIETKETKYMHPLSSVAAFLKGAIWTAYGIVNVDLFIVIPNALGIAVGAVQALVFVILKCTRSNPELKATVAPNSGGVEEGMSRKGADEKARGHWQANDEEKGLAADGLSHKNIVVATQLSHLEKHGVLPIHTLEFI